MHTHLDRISKNADPKIIEQEKLSRRDRATQQDKVSRLEGGKNEREEIVSDDRLFFISGRVVVKEKKV